MNVLDLLGVRVGLRVVYELMRKVVQLLEAHSAFLRCGILQIAEGVVQPFSEFAEPFSENDFALALREAFDGCGDNVGDDGGECRQEGGEIVSGGNSL